MINSMTGFARAETNHKNFSVVTEIRSYNHRHLDIALHIPNGYLALEEPVKGLISSKVTRGRIEIRLKIREENDASLAFEIDGPKAKAYHSALVELKKKFDIKAEIPLDLLVREGGLIKSVEVDKDVEANRESVEDCVNRAMDDLVAMRKREGDFIAGDFEKRLCFIEELLNKIEIETHDLVIYYQERLKERMASLTRGIEIDPARLAQEAAFFADRSDVSEEITRVGSHIKQFRQIMDSHEPGGRKLNFLLQELNREFNTIGSKTEKPETSHRVVEVKSELEKIREQIQNVE